MKHVHLHTGTHSKRWVYIAIGKWQPFAKLMHGGWIYLNWRWLWRFLYVVPKERGWRWG